MSEPTETHTPEDAPRELPAGQIEDGRLTYVAVSVFAVREAPRVVLATEAPAPAETVHTAILLALPADAPEPAYAQAVQAAVESALPPSEGWRRHNVQATTNVTVFNVTVTERGETPPVLHVPKRETQH